MITGAIVVAVSCLVTMGLVIWRELTPRYRRKR